MNQTLLVYCQDNQTIQYILQVMTVLFMNWKIMTLFKKVINNQLKKLLHILYRQPKNSLDKNNNNFSWQTKLVVRNNNKNYKGSN